MEHRIHTRFKGTKSSGEVCKSIGKLYLQEIPDATFERTPTIQTSSTQDM